MPDIYTIHEILNHNTLEDCWLIANNKVYNASEFLKIHPAHTNRILKYGGKDVTKDFNFHTKNQKKQWKKYLIGYVNKQPDKCLCITF
tara:strand:+ start:326 stop:589 length:264 start_codon:yes stop_codon:yes gene_type:complete